MSSGKRRPFCLGINVLKWNRSVAAMVKLSISYQMIYWLGTRLWQLCNKSPLSCAKQSAFEFKESIKATKGKYYIFVDFPQLWHNAPKHPWYCPEITPTEFNDWFTLFGKKKNRNLPMRLNELVSMPCIWIRINAHTFSGQIQFHREQDNFKNTKTSSPGNIHVAGS